ncbi:hypothetical protein [Liquorilactobacillus satsumensis]|uniref:Uncharacterized protein n=1 Tax=Liquorilactobacillus satsumensis DSM 16230 = JCM 12392 TaxID=1423801 RepID=A0A0R1V157_9LACO|nr:hypothetical protein FD50_GL001658 [Liquorilactobacillus satsumensis DSM 16230 = JCM 12392]MCP9359127.1 hypothetical protein [Liquorilactobacillus satsumensis]
MRQTLLFNVLAPAYVIKLLHAKSTVYDFANMSYGCGGLFWSMTALKNGEKVNI